MSRTISPVTTIVVDGYTWLSPGRKGLGMHLWDSLGGTISVVGVAKTPFKDTAAIEVFRGTSKRPLFVTSQGIDPQEAARLVETMAGRHRFPDMLKRVDHLCRGHCQPDAEAW